MGESQLSAILVAAGRSRRMGFDKLMSPVAGRPVFVHSLEAFEKCPEVERVVVVAPEDKVAEFEALAEGFGKVSDVIAGGAERHLSVWAGLQRAGDARFVAVHDAARPLVTPELISECFRLAEKTGAACCAAPISDTVKRASEENVVTESVDRAGLWAMQTPQIFEKALLVEAYESLIASGELATDEVSAIQRIGRPVSLLRNDDWNLKVTFPRDLAMVEHILAVRRNPGA